MMNGVDTFRTNKWNKEFHHGQPQKVLVVEDDPFWQEAITHAITKRISKFVSIQYARNQLQADYLMSYDNFDLVIFDQTLEGIGTGLELWQLRRESYDLTPMIMFTSANTNELYKLIQFKGHSPHILDKESGLKNLMSFVKLFLTPENMPNQTNGDLKSPPKVVPLPVGRKNRLLIAATTAFLVLAGTLQNNFAPKRVQANPQTISVDLPSNTPKEDRLGGNPITKKVAHNRYVTPELQAAVNRIIARADEVNQQSKKVKIRNFGND